MSIITNSEEYRKELSEKLRRFCKDFDLYSLLKRFGAQKARGIFFRKVFDFLFALVFTGKNLYNTRGPMSRDTVYRFLNNAKIHTDGQSRPAAEKTP